MQPVGHKVELLCLPPGTTGMTRSGSMDRDFTEQMDGTVSSFELALRLVVFEENIKCHNSFNFNCFWMAMIRALP